MNANLTQARRGARHARAITATLALATLAATATLAPAQRRAGGWAQQSAPGSEASATTGPATTSRPTSAPTDAYAAVVDRNIFLRERHRPAPVAGRGGASRPAAPPASLEASLVLRGVVLEDGVFRAYFENAQSNEIVRVAAGDPLAKGRVAQISIDAIEFETGAGHAWIGIGDNLVGASVGQPAPSASSQPAGGSPALSSIEERMRQRRQQRSGQ